MNQVQHPWWKEEIIYQIYPRSFQDSNDDGTGDLQGILQRLEHVKSLGVNAIWISPIFESPMKDFGYDISDYRAIHPLFGTMEDFDALLHKVHQLGMKLILDLVPNHTSDQHPWFKESRASRDNPKRDWYLWHDAREDGSPPNNWLSVFGGPAWTWDEATGQYYYHAFLKEQPDLNWRNPEVQEAIFEVMRYWFDKGIDGFRVDVMWHLIKDKLWRDNPVNPDYDPLKLEFRKLLPVYSTDQPEVHAIVEKMRTLADSYGDKLIIGEIYLPIERLVLYYGTDNQGAHLPFNFQLISLPWDAQQLAIAIDQYEAMLPEKGWPNWVLSNHDKKRIASRVGQQQARVAAMMLLTLRGTPTIYYGDEIGMMDVPVPESGIRDPQGLHKGARHLTRDPQRSPMQWNDETASAGFSKATPWLPVAANYKRVNVARQSQDDFSILTLYRRLIALRQREPALKIGAYHPVYSDHQLLSYKRHHADTSFLIVLNLTHATAYFEMPENLKGRIELSTHPELEGGIVSGTISLGGDEGLLIRLE